MSSTAAHDMSHDLHIWLMNEMQYDATGADGYRMIPTPENLAELYVGQLPDVWKYLMENIYGPHSIHTIKGNLQLCQGYNGKKMMSSPEEKSLQGRKETLTKNLHQANSNIQHLESEILKLEEEIIHKRSAVLERREAVRREQRLAACHRLQSERCQTELGGAARLTVQLCQLTGDPATASEQQQHEQEDGQTACMRQISEAADLLAGHIDRCLEQAPTADSLARAERTIQRTVKRHSAAAMLRGLAGLQHRADLQLTRRLQQAEQTATGHCDSATSDADPVLQKIQRSVDELHALHVTWRVTELTAGAEVKQLRRQLQQLLGQLVSQHQDDADVDWAGHLEAAVMRGRTVAMETAVRQLTAEVATLAEARAALEQRYAAIQRNQELIERNKCHIQLLVSLARDSLELSRTAQQRAAAAAERQLTPLLAALLAAHRQLTDDVSREAEVVSRWLLTDLRWVLLDGRAVPAGHLPLPGRPASDRAAVLSRRLRSSEAELAGLLAAQCRRQQEAARTEALLQLRDALTQSEAHTEQLEECRRRVESQMEHERTTLMPQLERLFVNMSQMGAALKQARTALHNWTDQPARATVQEVQHAGHTLKQWEQRYLAAVAPARVPHRPRPRPQTERSHHRPAAN